MSIKSVILAGLLILCGVCSAQSLRPAQRRCGWFENPTPANAWLTDRDGEWTIAVQGGHQADGDWPKFRRSRWVRTNGNYGYGCACMKLLTDPNSHYVQGILSSSARRLQDCREDPALREPKPN
jgi:hypothetical protein